MREGTATGPVVGHAHLPAARDACGNGDLGGHWTRTPAGGADVARRAGALPGPARLWPMPDLDPADLAPRAVYLLLTSLVTPRPIAWVSSLGQDGTANLAPHSYFNIVSGSPPIVHFTSTGEKDSLRNVRATGEFVVNIVTRDLAEPMNVTSANFPSDIDEFTWTGLERAPSMRVRPPRVAAAKAALECRVESILSKGDGNMVFGDVVHIHVADSIWRDEAVDPARLPTVGRLGGPNYADTGDIFSMRRPTWKELRG